MKGTSEERRSALSIRGLFKPTQFKEQQSRMMRRDVLLKRHKTVRRKGARRWNNNNELPEEMNYRVELF
jgi:hypothetical protein